MVSAGAALRALWTDRARIEIAEIRGDADGVARIEWRVLAEDEPCRLSFAGRMSASEAARPSGSAAAVAQAAKLFLRAGIDIAPGSRITVTRADGSALCFESSGIAARFSAHQEIGLSAARRFA